MICLDTNYLIRSLVPGSREETEVIGWAEAKQPLITATACWYEFLCGPVSELQISTIRSILERVAPFGEREAAEAARLYNAVGRVRSLRVDAMIAGTAVAAGATLATANKIDFERFRSAGLQLL